MQIRVWLEKKYGPSWMPLWLRTAPRAVKYLVAETSEGVLQIKTVLCSIAGIPSNCANYPSKFTVLKGKKAEHFRWRTLKTKAGK